MSTDAQDTWVPVEPMDKVYHLDGKPFVLVSQGTQGSFGRPVRNDSGKWQKLLGKVAVLDSDEIRRRDKRGYFTFGRDPGST